MSKQLKEQMDPKAIEKSVKFEEVHEELLRDMALKDVHNEISFALKASRILRKRIGIRESKTIGECILAFEIGLQEVRRRWISSTTDDEAMSALYLAMADAMNDISNLKS